MVKYSGILFLIIIFLSCGKDDNNGVPEVYVRYNLTIQEFELNDVNGVLTVHNEGVAGIIIYKAPDNTYKAYDRCSTVNPEKKCAVVPDDGSFTATDPCSGAKYFLSDGSPAKAPAVRSLKRYRVSTTNFQILVSND
jgi:nitrite reductase/ring-hydroxylating ferredoxin subunit